MSQPAKDTVRARDFPGLILNMDSTDIKAGSAREQTNMTPAVPAVLQVRPGYRVVSFEDVS